MEVFKKSIIEGLEVSNFGTVKRISDNKILAIHTDFNGYRIIKYDNKQIKVHRLVASAFCEKSENNNCVCHKNDVKADNRSENLYWGNYSTNNKDRFINRKDTNKGVHNPRYIDSEVFIDFPYNFKKKIKLRNLTEEDFIIEKHELIINKKCKKRWKYKYTLKNETY